jgi:hypothetical protein
MAKSKTPKEEDELSEEETSTKVKDKGTTSKSGLNYTAIGILVLFVLPAVLAGIIHVST